VCLQAGERVVGEAVEEPVVLGGTHTKEVWARTVTSP
jgi:hypothetical protein